MRPLLFITPLFFLRLPILKIFLILLRI